MVNSCCVVGCHNSVRKKPGLRFLAFLLGIKSDYDGGLRLLSELNRSLSTTHTRICSDHFIEGKTNHSFVVKWSLGKPHRHCDHPDYVPSIFLIEYTCNKKVLPPRRVLVRKRDSTPVSPPPVSPPPNESVMKSDLELLERQESIGRERYGRSILRRRIQDYWQKK